MKIDDNILDGGPGPKNVDDGAQSLGELCMNRLDKLKNQTLLIDVNTGKDWTGHQIKENAIALSLSLMKSISVNDVIGICSENRIEFVTTLFAAFAAGITITTLNSGYSEGTVFIFKMEYLILINTFLIQVKSTMRYK